MKLISCHIDGFGAISDRDYSFDESLTGFVAENGAGKSTLAAFLSAMFYGLPGVRANAKEFNDRKHFYPFTGGAFGGSLAFTTDAGDRYLIRREFDAKSETQDDVTVQKNGAPFDCRGREIGEILFGVDGEAFSRTVFLSADTLDTDPGKSIADRLCEAVSNPDGTVPAEKAISALDAAAKKIVQGRGKNGLLDQALAVEADTDAALRTARAEAKRLPDLQKEYEVAERELAAQNERKLWDSYDDLLARAKTEEAKLAVANERFAGGVPDEGALADVEEKIAARERTAHDAEKGFSPTARQNELAARFQNKVPDDAALSAMESKAQEIRAAQQTAIPTVSPQNPSPETKKSGGWALPVAAVGGLAFLAGLILLILSLELVGGILLGLGVLGLGAGLYYLIQRRLSALERSIAVVDPGGAERARRAQLDADLSALLAPYGASSPDGALAAYADLKRDLKELADFENETADAAEKRAAAKERLAALDGEMSAFFRGFSVSVDAGYRAAMNELRESLRSRKALLGSIELAKMAAADFALKQGLTVRPVDVGSVADPDAIREKEQRKTALAVEIDRVTRTANRVPELEDALANAGESVKELKVRYARLTKARDLMQAAQESLVRRYVDPVKSSFVAYADALSSFLGKKVALDSRFALAYEENGALRDVRHLSRGENGVAALCLRMALADSLYEGKEQPPLILDDPLVHLDENNLEKAKELLREVAKKRQILCLTCHGSRAV